jgi:hypothetical protein
MALMVVRTTVKLLLAAVHERIATDLIRRGK